MEPFGHRTSTSHRPQAVNPEATINTGQASTGRASRTLFVTDFVTRSVWIGHNAGSSGARDRRTPGLDPPAGPGRRSAVFSDTTRPTRSARDSGRRCTQTTPRPA